MAASAAWTTSHCAPTVCIQSPTGVDERGIDTNATDPALRRTEAATKIWAAGVQASPLARVAAEAAGAGADRAGRVQVRPDCTLPGHPEVFVVGDRMTLDHRPGLAQVAIQSGRHAAETIARRLDGGTAERPFRYRDLGTMATVSRFRAMDIRGWARVLKVRTPVRRAIQARSATRVRKSTEGRR